MLLVNVIGATAALMLRPSMEHAERLEKIGINIYNSSFRGEYLYFLSQLCIFASLFFPFSSDFFSCYIFYFYLY